jgi:serine/threonine-protein kinase
MAEIWLARQSGLKGFEKLVVIKRMGAELAADPESVDMFLTEARLAAQLTHPNVVQIYELGEQGGSLYIAMEYLDGEDLAAVRRTGQKHGLPLLDHYAAKLLSLAAEGLHYAHTMVGIDGRALRIVHRDVSPQNLIVTFSGGLKVVDFGIAKAATQHTNSGKLKGKLAYMSPEQARGEQLDARSDVFSLGIVLFEVATRTRLLPKMNDLELLSYMAGEDPFPRPSDRRADLPEGLEPIILKAMERRRELRFQSAREFQDALEGWIRSQGKSVSTGELADYMRTVFVKRIHERRQLIETAMTAELTPSSAQHLRDLAQSEQSSSRSRSQTHSTDGSRKPLLAALVALSVVVLGIGVAVVRRATQEEVQPPAQAVAQPTPPTPAVVVAPPTLPAVLVIDTVPPGARLTLDGVDHGAAPAILEGLSREAHEVVATLEGYEPAKREVSGPLPGERVRMELALVPIVAPPPVAPVEPVEPKKPVTARKAPPRVEASGKLTLKTTPWTTAYLGKRKLGDTPLINVTLPAGRHTLRLVSPETNTENSIEVEIKANETTVKKLKF